MTERQRKHGLWAANAAMAIAVVVAASAAFWPLEDAPSPRQASTSRPAGRGVAADRKVLSLEQYADGFSRNLRMPLVDAAPASRTAMPHSAPAQPVLRLMGTVLERNNNFAVFMLPNREERMVGIGETIEDALVVAITNSSATLKFKGQTIVLRMENAEGAKPGLPGSSQGMPDIIIGRGGIPLITGRMARRGMATMPASQPAEGATP